MIILRSDYLRLQLDSEEAERLRGLEATYQYSTLNEMQAKLDLIEKQCEYWQKQATSEFLNMYFRVFMVYYIFFALLYPNSREIVWATFLIQSAETRTTLSTAGP